MAISKLSDGTICDIPAPKNLTQEQFNNLKIQTQTQKKVMTRIKNKIKNASK